MCSAAAAAEAEAQSVRARVLDAESGAAVAGARVTLRAADGRTAATGITNAEGRVLLVVEAGSFGLEASHVEYLTSQPLQLQLRDEEELLLELRLSRTVVVLDALEVTGRRRDLRQDATRAGMLARRELYADTWNRMVIMHGDAEMIGTSIAEILRRLPTSLSSGCRIFFWEGGLVNTPAEVAFLQSRSPHHVGAVEFYRTWHEAPLAYRQAPGYLLGSPMFCSIVALWSRPDAPEAPRTRWPIAVAISAAMATLVLLLAR